MWVAWMAVDFIAFLNSKKQPMAGRRQTEMAIFNQYREKLNIRDGSRPLPPSSRLSPNRPSFSGSDDIRVARPARGV